MPAAERVIVPQSAQSRYRDRVLNAAGHARSSRPNRSPYTGRPLSSEQGRRGRGRFRASLRRDKAVHDAHKFATEFRLVEFRAAAAQTGERHVSHRITHLQRYAKPLLRSHAPENILLDCRSIRRRIRNHGVLQCSTRIIASRSASLCAETYDSRLMTILPAARAFSRSANRSSTIGPTCATLPAPSVSTMSPGSAIAVIRSAASENDAAYHVIRPLASVIRCVSVGASIPAIGASPAL